MESGYMSLKVGGNFEGKTYIYHASFLAAFLQFERLVSGKWRFQLSGR